MSRLLLSIICVSLIALVAYHFWPSSEGMLPNDVTNGEVIRCFATGKVFMIEKGHKRWYSWKAYTFAGKPKFVLKNCSTVSAIPDGPDMPDN